MSAKRRGDYNTDCPSCGGPGTLSNKVSSIHYRCTECANRYEIKPNLCRACSKWIADGVKYCEWHSSRGFKDEPDEDIVQEGMCLRCKRNQTHDIYEYCESCLNARETEEHNKISRQNESKVEFRDSEEKHVWTTLPSDHEVDDENDDSEDDLEDDGLDLDVDETEEVEETDEDPWDVEDDWDDED